MRSRGATEATEAYTEVRREAEVANDKPRSGHATLELSGLAGKQGVRDRAREMDFIEKCACRDPY